MLYVIFVHVFCCSANLVLCSMLASQWYVTGPNMSLVSLDVDICLVVITGLCVSSKASNDDSSCAMQLVWHRQAHFYHHF